MSNIRIMPDTITKKPLNKFELAKAMFEGHLLRDGWEDRKRKALLNCKNTLMDLLKNNRSLYQTAEYEQQVSNFNLFLSNIDELMKLLPSWVGCSDGKIIVGENKSDIRKQLISPYLIVEIEG